MALNLTKSHTAVAGDTIPASGINTNFDDLYNAFSGLEAATASMSKLPLDADPTSALYAATKQYVDHYGAYRRPVLEYVSTTTVRVENNTGTANQTSILFPDGNLRSVTENTGSTHKYRLFTISATAEFTTGTEDSGLYTGLSEETNTWYAIYAVKSTINTANFVLVGTKTLPIQANYSTLNTNLGTNGWVYLGLIRNGDNSAATGDICSFRMCGNTTFLTNTVTVNYGGTACGVIWSSSASDVAQTWTYAAGTANLELPNNISFVNVFFGRGAGATAKDYVTIMNGTANRANLTGRVAFSSWGVPNGDVSHTTDTTAVPMDIVLKGFMDIVLGVGSNPML